jgi:hypothetical protein
MARGRKPTLPWDEIDPLLIGGALSIAEIAERYGCATRTLRKRIAKYDLGADGPVTATIIARARKNMRHRARKTLLPACEIDARRDAVNVMVSTIVEVVGRHQEQICAARETVRKLFDDMADVVNHRHELERQITEDVDTRRERFMRAVSLPVHAQTVNALAGALEKLIKLERQAWAIPETLLPEPEKEGEADTPEVLRVLQRITQEVKEAADKHRTVEMSRSEA